MLDFANKNGSKVLLCEIPYICEEKFKNSNGGRRINSNKNIEGYNAVVRKLGEKYADVLVSQEWILSQDNQLEIFEYHGLHLSAKGHEIFAEKWLTNALKYSIIKLYRLSVLEANNGF